MISESEIKRLAGKFKLDPMIIDLDYALSCILAGIFDQYQLSEIFLFKGGTCLKKCYFEDYRFSQDLDFTLAKQIPLNELKTRLYHIIPQIEQNFDLMLSEKEPRWEILNDEYGKESIEIRFYYRGPLRWRGEPQAIRIDISREEVFIYKKEMKSLKHFYSDKNQFYKILIPCYSLEEILLEKLRGLLGQRKFIIARDLFDVGQILKLKPKLTIELKGLIQKFQIKGMDSQNIKIDVLYKNKSLFKESWERHLFHLLPFQYQTDFEETWTHVILFLENTFFKK